MNSIQLKAVSFSREQPLFEKTNLAIPQGTFSLLIGDSGSGKSTLLRLIAGFAPLDYQGEILIEGMERRQLSTREKTQKIGMLFQNPSQQFTMKTLERELIFALENLGISPEEMNRKIQTALQLVQTQTLFTRELATLSGGEKQKAALTVLLAMNPDILLLDEPFASIDPTSRKQFIQILARLHQAGKTILVCDHDFNDYADVVDQVVTLKNGQFEKQPLTFIKTKPQTFQLTTSVVKQPMLQLKNFRLSQGKRVLLEEKEALLFKGITTLTGPNGAGKSTLLKAIVQRQKYQGKMFLAGRRLRASKKLYQHMTLAVQQANRQFVTLTLREELLFGQNMTAEKRRKQEEALTFLGLKEKLEHSVFQLSEGQKKMVQLISLLSLDLDCLLLDEPFAGLDERACNYFVEWIKEKSAQQDFLIVTHRLEPLSGVSNYRIELPLLPAIGTFWSIYLHGTSSQQAWLLFSRTYAFAGLGLAFAVGVDFEELLLLLEQKGLAPNFVYGILVVVHALPEVKREINDLKEASLLRGKTFHFWSPMLYVKTLLVAVSWRDKYTEAMSAHGYEEGATRSRKEHFVSAKVSLGLAILIIIFTNLFIFLT